MTMMQPQMWGSQPQNFGFAQQWGCQPNQWWGGEDGYVICYVPVQTSNIVANGMMVATHNNGHVGQAMPMHPMQFGQPPTAHARMPPPMGAMLLPEQQGLNNSRYGAQQFGKGHGKYAGPDHDLNWRSKGMDTAEALGKGPRVADNAVYMSRREVAASLRHKASRMRSLHDMTRTLQCRRPWA